MAETNFEFYKIKSMPVKKTIAIDRLKDLEYRARFQDKVVHKLEEEGKENDNNEPLQDKWDKNQKVLFRSSKINCRLQK